MVVDYLNVLSPRSSDKTPLFCLYSGKLTVI